ncbi:MAG: glycosyltransferase [Actinobacteria bacterium]|nr:MAG: glycosyltransferase [Actinomycetota bacterium]
MTFGCVVLTTGSRPDVLALALDSLRSQRGVELDVVVVFNGAEPLALPPRTRALGLAEDLGIPAARNAGADQASGELLFFLDDDASLGGDDALARVAARFDADPSLGALQLGVAPRGGGAYSRDWVPRLRVGDRTRPSDVAVLWEGAVAVRRSVFDLVGGWPGEFRFVHEGVDLAWRILDAGFRVHYAGDIGALHPPPAPVAAGERHAYSSYYGARNRVWLARRHLPLPLGALFVATFAVRTLPRVNARSALRGYLDGVRGPYPARRKLRARTLWRMTRVGRPPVI